ncbi:hypothetical protein PUN28_001938 [Cardiocondyla obscurior]|uniref:Uncharacterized protein n=1 Tax=Cardiocondyla obscurior TaxID=286306 RepID=A0AAW2GRY5_9HYME
MEPSVGKSSFTNAFRAEKNKPRGRRDKISRLNGRYVGRDIRLAILKSFWTSISPVRPYHLSSRLILDDIRGRCVYSRFFFFFFLTNYVRHLVKFLNVFAAYISTRVIIYYRDKRNNEDRRNEV